MVEGAAQRDGPDAAPSLVSQPPASRAAAVIQVLSGAVGLGAYIVLAGGIAEWARMSGAGLPASQALSAYEPITLLASGFQTLLLIPLTLIFVFIVVKVSEDVHASPKELRELRLVARGWDALQQLVILYFAVVVSLVPALSLVSVLIFVSASAIGTAGLICATALAAWFLLRVLVRRAEDLRGELSDQLGDVRHIVGRVPTVVRMPLLIAARSAWFGPGAGALLMATCLLLLASDGREAGLDLGLFRLDEISDGVLLAAFIAIMALLTIVALAIAGRLWLARALRLVGIESERDEAHERAKFSFWAAAVLLCPVIFFPLSAAVLIVSVLLVGFFVDYLAERDMFARALIFSGALALGLMGYQARSPQEFDRIDFEFPAAKKEERLRVRAALIGTRGDSSWSACATAFVPTSTGGSAGGRAPRRYSGSHVVMPSTLTSSAAGTRFGRQTRRRSPTRSHRFLSPGWSYPISSPGPIRRSMTRVTSAAASTSRRPPLASRPTCWPNERLADERVHGVRWLVARARSQRCRQKLALA